MASVPTLDDLPTGILTSSQINAQLIAAGRFMQQRPRAKLVQRTLQAIATSTFTAITFDAEILDTDVDSQSGHDNATNNTRWTCRYPGYHWISGAYCCDVSATGGRYAIIRINGVDQESTLGFTPGIASIATVAATRPTKIFMTAGDYVELIGWQNSGGSLNTYVGSDYARSSLDILWEST